VTSTQINVIARCQKWQHNDAALLELTVGNGSSATVQAKGMDAGHRLQTQHQACRFFLVLRQLSRDILVDAGFLRDKVARLRDKINRTSSTDFIIRLYSTLVHFKFVGAFNGAIHPPSWVLVAI
jgi:hypothetical protein